MLLPVLIFGFNVPLLELMLVSSILGIVALILLFFNIYSIELIDNKLEILIHDQSRIVSEEKKELSLMKKMDDLDRQIDEDLLLLKQPPKKKEVISKEGVVADS